MIEHTSGAIVEKLRMSDQEQGVLDARARVSSRTGRFSLLFSSWRFRSRFEPYDIQSTSSMVSEGKVGCDADMQMTVHGSAVTPEN